MASSIANDLETKVLKKVFNTTDFTTPGIWVKLHNGDPGEDCTSLPANNLIRAVATFNTATAGQVNTSANVEWTNVSNTETYTHISLWDNVSSGNACWYGQLTTPRAVTLGDTFRIPAGSLVITLD